jgi:hypothetical protein
MMINNIYLVIIILLILLIIFLIFQSHQYTNIEGFIIPQLPTITNYTTNTPDDLNNDYKIFNIISKNKIVNNINKKNLKTNINLQQNKFIIEDLKKKARLISQSNIIEFPPDKPIKTIKSNYNSQLLSTSFLDSNKYNIIANNKCLTVGGLCTGEFCLQNCQSGLYSSSSQRFKSERINNKFEAAKFMNVDKSYIMDNNVYPYNVFMSDINNKCLTSVNGGITIDKCNLNNKQQQWLISPDDNICKLE